MLFTESSGDTCFWSGGLKDVLTLGGRLRGVLIVDEGGGSGGQGGLVGFAETVQAGTIGTIDWGG